VILLDLGSEILSFLSIVGISILKYLFGLIAALHSSSNVFLSMSANIIGGFLSTLFYLHLGSYLKHKFIYWKYYSKGLKPKIFTRKNRKLVRFRNKFGLLGIAAISPTIITMSVGIPLALSLTDNKKKIFIYFALSCFIWTSVVFLIYLSFGVQFLEYFRMKKYIG
jgi:hypothetical protein